MPRFQLLPGARSLAFNGGDTVYADRRGMVRVSDEQASEIRRSSALRRYDSMVEIAPVRGFAKRDEDVCLCGFAYWPWTATCPKCGAVIRPEE